MGPGYGKRMATYEYTGSVEWVEAVIRDAEADDTHLWIMDIPVSMLSTLISALGAAVDNRRFYATGQQCLEAQYLLESIRSVNHPNGRVSEVASAAEDL